ncbi:MAG: Hpt domain-containing protein [Magnetospirillum sp.]|nr:Hpt domain-containing protein [Magnetospirillum sp.]
MGGNADSLVDADAVARAEAAVSSLAEAYVVWAKADAARLVACHERLRSDPHGRRHHLSEIFRIAHDIKGQAATFGFPLWSDIANRLCRLAKKCPAGDECWSEPIAAHVAVLDRVIAAGLGGGREAPLILAELDKGSSHLLHDGASPID